MKQFSRIPSFYASNGIFLYTNFTGKGQKPGIFSMFLHLHYKVVCCMQLAKNRNKKGKDIFSIKRKFVI